MEKPGTRKVLCSDSRPAATGAGAGEAICERREAALGRDESVRSLNGQPVMVSWTRALRGFRQTASCKHVRFRVCKEYCDKGIANVNKEKSLN